MSKNYFTVIWIVYMLILLNVILVDTYVGNGTYLHVIDESVNCETRALFEYCNFYARNIDEAWDFLN